MVARGPPKTKVAGSSPVMVDLFWCFPLTVLVLLLHTTFLFLLTASAAGNFVVLVCGEEVASPEGKTGDGLKWPPSNL